MDSAGPREVERRESYLHLHYRHLSPCKTRVGAGDYFGTLITIMILVCIQMNSDRSFGLTIAIVGAVVALGASWLSLVARSYPFSGITTLVLGFIALIGIIMVLGGLYEIVKSFFNKESTISTE